MFGRAVPLSTVPFWWHTRPLYIECKGRISRAVCAYTINAPKVADGDRQASWIFYIRQNLSVWMGAWKGQVDTRRRRHRRASASTFQPPVLGRPLFNERVIKRKEKKNIFLRLIFQVSLLAERMPPTACRSRSLFFWRVNEEFWKENGNRLAGHLKKKVRNNLYIINGKWSRPCGDTWLESLAKRKEEHNNKCLDWGASSRVEYFKWGKNDR